MSKTKVVVLLLAASLLICGCRAVDSENSDNNAAINSIETSAATDTSGVMKDLSNPMEASKPNEVSSETETELADPEGNPAVLEYKETESENLDDLTDYVHHIEQGLVDENGYVVSGEAFHRLLDTFYEEAQKACEQGVYVDVLKTDENVVVFLNSGLVYLYVPYREGILSGSGAEEGEIRVLSFNNFYEKEDEEPNQDKAIFDEMSKAQRSCGKSLLWSAPSNRITLEEEKTYASELYEHGNITIENIKKILDPGKRIIIIRGHGAFFNLQHSKLAADRKEFYKNFIDRDIATLIRLDMEYDPSLGMDYYNDILGIATTEEVRRALGFLWVIDRDYKMYLTPKFFRTLSTEPYLNGSIVMLMSCHGAQEEYQNDLIYALLEKGADVVIGFNEATQIAYLGEFSESMLLQIANNQEKTFSQILQQAKTDAETVDEIIHEVNGITENIGTDHTNDYRLNEDEPYTNAEALIFGWGKDLTVEEWLKWTSRTLDLSFIYEVKTWEELLQHMDKLGANDTFFATDGSPSAIYALRDTDHHIWEIQFLNSPKFGFRMQFIIYDPWSWRFDLGNGIVIGRTTERELETLGFEQLRKSYSFSEGDEGYDFIDSAENKYAYTRSYCIKSMVIQFSRGLENSEKDPSTSAEGQDFSFLYTVKTWEELNQKIEELGWISFESQVSLNNSNIKEYYFPTEEDPGRISNMLTVVNQGEKLYVQVSVADNCLINLGNGIVIGKTTTDEMTAMGWINTPNGYTYTDKFGNDYTGSVKDGVLRGEEFTLPFIIEEEGDTPASPEEPQKPEDPSVSAEGLDFTFIYNIKNWDEWDEPLEELGIHLAGQTSGSRAHEKSYSGNGVTFKVMEYFSSPGEFQVDVRRDDGTLVNLGGGIILGKTTFSEFEKLGLGFSRYEGYYIYAEKVNGKRRMYYFTNDSKTDPGYITGIYWEIIPTEEDLGWDKILASIKKVDAVD